jgi:hypothetical protein
MQIKKKFREKLDNMMYNQVSIKLFLPDKYTVKIVDELPLRLIFSGGHTMKRLAISISVLLLFAFLALDKAVAQQPAKSLDQAIVDGDIDQVKSQLSAGADLNSKNRLGWTALHTAIRNRRTEIIKLLIDKGADVNAKDNRGRTPLHFAVETGQKDIVEMLIAKKAEINVMDSRADNALSLAKKGGNSEITDLLIKNGAKDPNPDELLGDRLYPSQGTNLNPNSSRLTQPGTSAGIAGQSSVAIDLLADPNEIKTRVKTFGGLEKEVKDVSDKSQNELRQWQQIKYDNRTILLRAVDKQFEDEIDYIQKVAVEESAKKTVEAIDNLRTDRRKRSLKVNKELLAQKREQRQAELASTRGRTTGRSTRGRTSLRGQASGTNATDSLYGGGSVTVPRGGFRSENAGQPEEQLDPQTQEQMRLWLQSTPENKLELARAIQPQIQAEIISIRTIAVEEQAKKTTAAIDGLLLARKERFDELTKKVEEETRKLQEAQNLRNRTSDQGQASQQNSRYQSRTRRGTGTQTDTQQQNNTRGTRTRRR